MKLKGKDKTLVYTRKKRLFRKYPKPEKQRSASNGGCQRLTLSDENDDSHSSEQVFASIDVSFHSTHISIFQTSVESVSDISHWPVLSRPDDDSNRCSHFFPFM